jgi:hypothetical protein
MARPGTPSRGSQTSWGGPARPWAPRFLTNGLRAYRTALVTHYGRGVQPERRQSQDPQPKARWLPLPGLLYAQVLQPYQRQRLVGGQHRVIFGAAQPSESILAKRAWTLPTAFAERLKLDLRQHGAAMGQRVKTLCPHEAGLPQQLTLFHVSHNFVLPHASLRLPLPEVAAEPDTGAIKCWQAQTPAMAAGRTDRVCRVREVLGYRLPPWPHALMGSERVMVEGDEERRGNGVSHGHRVGREATTIRWETG